MTTTTAPTLHERPAITLCGATIRTGPASAAVDIPALWQRFERTGIRARIPGAPTTIHVAYLDYERDFRGAYTMLIGGVVPAGTVAPDDLRVVEVPAGRYARLTAPDVAGVADAWGRVWATWPDPATRRYVVDLEVYDPARLPEVELLVGLP